MKYHFSDKYSKSSNIFAAFTAAVFNIFGSFSASTPAAASLA
jgi:hypothetical protein